MESAFHFFHVFLHMAQLLSLLIPFFFLFPQRCLICMKLKKLWQTSFFCWCVVDSNSFWMSRKRWFNSIMIWCLVTAAFSRGSERTGWVVSSCVLFLLLSWNVKKILLGTFDEKFYLNATDWQKIEILYNNIWQQFTFSGLFELLNLVTDSNTAHVFRSIWLSEETTV